MLSEMGNHINIVVICHSVGILKYTFIVKMKFLLLISALVFVADAAVIKSSNSTRSNFSVGYVQPYDVLLQRVYLNQPARPNAIQYQDYVYKGNYNTRISAVYAMEVGPTQYATAWIIRGGVGYNNVTVRVQSAKGYGYYFQIDIWGR